MRPIFLTRTQRLAQAAGRLLAFIGTMLLFAVIGGLIGAGF